MVEAVISLAPTHECINTYEQVGEVFLRRRLLIISLFFSDFFGTFTQTQIHIYADTQIFSFLN
jgi:hypothetical protein